VGTLKGRRKRSERPMAPNRKGVPSVKHTSALKQKNHKPRGAAVKGSGLPALPVSTKKEGPAPNGPKKGQRREGGNEGNGGSDGT